MIPIKNLKVWHNLKNKTTNEKLALASEFIQCGFLVGTFITSIILNYVPYEVSIYEYRKVGYDSYAIKLPDSIENMNYSMCTNLTESEFKSIMELRDSNLLATFIKAQYWICFLIVGAIQAFAWYNRTFEKVKDKYTKIVLVAVKIFFAPSIFAVSIIDYNSPCIYLSVGTFFITLASLANCALLVLVCIGCAHLCKKEEDNLVNIALLVFCIYVIMGLVIYVAIYFGPLFTKLENIALTINMGLDAISSYYS